MEGAMNDPYQVLGLPPEADDETIRRRYLELVRQFSPEQHPEKFAAVRGAYEQLRDQNTRLRHRLFEAGKRETVDAIIEEVTCRRARRRVSLKELLTAVLKP
jgi:curved DNA-binding protein CbpA